MSSQFHTQATLLQHNGPQIFNQMPGGHLFSSQQVSIGKTASPAKMQPIDSNTCTILLVLFYMLKGIELQLRN